MTAEEIVRAAEAEVRAEDERACIEIMKARIRAQQGRSLWRRLFPFRITIERID